MPAKCPKGKIRRASFVRKNSKTGKKVNVKSACVPDKGAKGKTPKNKRILPQPGKEISLSRFGYKLSKTRLARRRSLARASKTHSARKVLGRIGLLRNLTAEPGNKNKMSQDVKWMSGYYAKTEGKGSKKNSKRANKRSNKRSKRRN